MSPLFAPWNLRDPDKAMQKLPEANMEHSVGDFVSRFVFQRPSVIRWLQGFTSESFERFLLPFALQSLEAPCESAVSDEPELGAPGALVPPAAASASPAALPPPQVQTEPIKGHEKRDLSQADVKTILTRFIDTRIAKTDNDKDVFDIKAFQFALRAYMLEEKVPVNEINKFMNEHAKDRPLCAMLKEILGPAHTYKRSDLRAYSGIQAYSRDILPSRYPPEQFIQDDGTFLVKINSHFNKARFPQGGTLVPSLPDKVPDEDGANGANGAKGFKKRKASHITLIEEPMPASETVTEDFDLDGLDPFDPLEEEEPTLDGQGEEGPPSKRLRVASSTSSSAESSDSETAEDGTEAPQVPVVLVNGREHHVTGQMRPMSLTQKLKKGLIQM